MTPSIEERRETAERLRRLDRTISSHSSTEEAINEFLCALYGNATFSTIEMSPRNLCGAAMKLADLIGPERTCRMIDNGVELCCSACDRRHGYDDEPAFCMGCGARVVEE